MKKPLSLPRLIAYGLPGLPLAILGLPLYVYLPTYYARDLMLGTPLVGSILLAARLFDVVTDPAAGLLSDRLSLDNWRRRGMMVMGVPWLLIGIWMLFLPPAGIGAGWLLLGTLLAYLGWTLVSIPYAAWGAELSPDYHERSRLAASREGFQALGVLLALAVPTFAGIAEDAGATLRLLFACVALTLPLTVLIAVKVLSESRWILQGPALTAGVRLLLSNQPLRRLLLAYVLDGLANGLPATLFLLFITERMQAPEATGPLLILYFGMGVVALPAWIGLARKIGKHRAWAISMGVAALSFTIVPWLGPGDLAVFTVTVAFTGLTLGADMALPTAIQADVVDVDTARGGGGRAGLLFGIWGMATKLALALAVGIAFPLLGLAGYDPALPTQPTSALTALGFLYAGLPVLLKLPCIYIAWRFPLDEHAQFDLQREIRRRKADLSTGEK
ncbi:MAG: MFS transporter [Methylohalobius crimeensis]